jgi:hypothetical protein
MQRMEITCLVALVIVFIADVLEIFTVRRFFAFSRSISGTFTYESWKNLDPEYLKEVFENRVKMSTMAGVTSIMSALSIFALIIPILQVSWILSQGGKRHVGLHVAVCVLALACGFTELITSLMLIGARNAFVFIVEMFDLDDWQLQRSDDESGSGGDGTGYRVLELIDIVVNGKNLIPYHTYTYTYTYDHYMTISLKNKILMTHPSSSSSSSSCFVSI